VRADGPQRLPVRALRLQLEHLTLLDHLETSSIGNGSRNHTSAAMMTTSLIERESLGLQRRRFQIAGLSRVAVHDSSRFSIGHPPLGTEARADEIEGGDAAVAEYAEEMLFDHLPRVAGPLHPEPVEDMQSIADLLAAGMNELEPVRFTEPGGELRSCGLCARNLKGTRRDQRAHAHVWRERAGEPAEVPLGDRRDQHGAQISS
jgi:hypothetical protein